MEKLVIKGGNRLSGTARIHGAKNAALPILCAALLCSDKVTLHNCPELSDVRNTIDILRYFGCDVKLCGETAEIVPCSCCMTEIPDEMMCKMRSSIIFLGAMLSKNKKARLCFPGGCELGPRPIDIHLECFRRLGIEVNEKNRVVDCDVKGKIKSASLSLPFPSVGATENVILATVLSSGKTLIYNAAREPEIKDLADFLNKCGADIKGAGEGLIEINGVKSLSGCEHTIIPDRIEASTYMSFAAVTGGKITLECVCPEHLPQVISCFAQSGCDVVCGEQTITIDAPKRLSRIKQTKSLVYPGFPTDSGMPLIAMCATANGTSVYEETIFQNRFKSVAELNKMGASIKIYDNVAVIDGVQNLYGAEVCATDLRGGAALVTAALCAKGTTIITGLSHIDRGYEGLEKALTNLGADIVRLR